MKKKVYINIINNYLVHDNDRKVTCQKTYRNEAIATLSTKRWVDPTNVIRENLTQKQLTSSQISYVYANEAGILNMTLLQYEQTRGQEVND